MADLMNSMNDDINLMSHTPPPPSAVTSSLNSNNCHVCHEEFDYRDQVTTVDKKVWNLFLIYFKSKPLLIYYKKKVLP